MKQQLILNQTSREIDYQKNLKKGPYLTPIAERIVILLAQRRGPWKTAQILDLPYGFVKYVGHKCGFSTKELTKRKDHPLKALFARRGE